jgi:hypothetical protein
MHICTVIELDTRFVTVIDSKVIGISRHKDYSLFHFKAHDVKALKAPISKFIFVDSWGAVDEVIAAEQLAARGVNYKTAKRDTAELTDVERVEVSGAVELARVALASGLKPKPEADTKPPIVRTPADGVPKVIITAEAAAAGLGEVLAKAESTPAGNSEAGEGESAADAVDAESAGECAATTDAAVEAEVEADTGGDGARDDTEGAAADTPADDPLATVKPSRKKRRR